MNRFATGFSLALSGFCEETQQIYAVGYWQSSIDLYLNYCGKNCYQRKQKSSKKHLLGLFSHDWKIVF
jgi:hypothetical protein